MYKTNRRDTILIEKYHDGELKGIELAEFEQRMLIDKGFSEEVKLHEEINKSIFNDFKVEYLKSHKHISPAS